MAQPIACDICSGENAVQMLTNLTTGEVLCMGPACLPVFYGQSVLGVMDAGEHKGLPQKCQACRRVHERMTLAGRPATDMDRPHQGEHDPGADPGDDDTPTGPIAGTEGASVSGDGITTQAIQ
jgi:hypothetical protein